MGITPLNSLFNYALFQQRLGIAHLRKRNIGIAQNSLFNSTHFKQSLDIVLLTLFFMGYSENLFYMGEAYMPPLSKI